MILRTFVFLRRYAVLRPVSTLSNTSSKNYDPLNPF
jgi:hypothetical protein